MDSAERREFLASRGFAVARDSFPGSRGPMWSMAELNFDGSRNKKCFGPHQFMIDLHSGRWQRCGEAWRDWQHGPWHEQVDDSECEQVSVIVGDSTLTNSRSNPPQGSVSAQSGARPAPLIVTPEFTADGSPVRRFFEPIDLQFFSDCVAVGFEIVNPAPLSLTNNIDLGNREAMFGGVSYGLHCRTKLIMGPGCQTFTLDHFRNRKVAPRVVPPAAPKPLPPMSRPVLSELRVPVEASGNTVQKGLFV